MKLFAKIPRLLRIIIILWNFHGSIYIANLTNRPLKNQLLGQTERFAYLFFLTLHLSVKFELRFNYLFCKKVFLM